MRFAIPLSACFLFALTGSAQELRLADQKPAPVNERDDELTRLLKQRRNELLAAARAQEELYRGGRVSLDELRDTALQFAKADFELQTERAAQVQSLKLAHDIAGTFEGIVRNRAERMGGEAVQVLARATALRQSAESEWRLARAPLLAGGEQTDNAAQLRELLEQRRQTAGEEVAAQLVVFRAGTATLESTCDAIERQAAASAALSDTPAERATALQGVLATARQVEEVIVHKFAADVEPKHALRRAQVLRLELAIALLRAKEVAGDEPELRRLLRARHDAASEELNDLRVLYRFGRGKALPDVAAAIQRQARTGKELAETPAERVTRLTPPYDASVEVETLVRSKFAQQVEPVQAMHLAIATRLAAEIELLRARRAAMP